MPRRLAVPALTVLLAAGCAPMPQTPATRANAAALASCRASTDAAFDRQNRFLLSERDTTDTPYSSSGVSGITTQGLSRQYEYGTELSDCLAARHAASPADQAATAVQPPPPTGYPRAPGL